MSELVYRPMFNEEMEAMTEEQHRISRSRSVRDYFVCVFLHLATHQQGATIENPHHFKII